MSTQSGWRHDAKGRAYFVDEDGRHIAVRPEGYKHGSNSVGGSTRPEVVEGHYKPFPGSANTYPPRDQPDYTFQSLTDHNRPHFGPGSQHSGRGNVDHPAARHEVAGVSRQGLSTDVYRDAKAGWGSAGPSTSEYDRRYKDYKARDRDNAAAASDYKPWKKNYKDNKPTEEAIADNRHVFGGTPKYTREWHQVGAQKATSAAQASAAHADGRRNFLQDFTGYHDHTYHPGHQKAIKQAECRERDYKKAAEYHNGFETLQDVIEREKSVAEARKAKEKSLESSRLVSPTSPFFPPTWWTTASAKSESQGSSKDGVTVFEAAASSKVVDED
ncbi:hypothetical protein F4779DRAFT_643145 [Xylariaceae sp. FL0662B]|nr:hypothetical protein F4779DRAFT_643145 [Xylariaceae sp. FL0662B]